MSLFVLNHVEDNRHIGTKSPGNLCQTKTKMDLPDDLEEVGLIIKGIEETHDLMIMFDLSSCNLWICAMQQS